MQLLGDSIYTNPLLLGYAWQKGRVPLSPRRAAARHRAQRRAGRQQQGRVRVGPALRARPGLRCRRCSRPPQVIQFVKKPSLDEMVAKRVEFLTGYQDAAYAAHYTGLRRQGARRRGAAEAARTLSEAVARYLFKLMAYKDEYEVARLHTDPAFTQKIAGMFEGDYKLVHHLAPPLLAKTQRPGRAGQAAVRPLGAQRLRRAGEAQGPARQRARPLRPTEERRTERALIGEYRACIEELLAHAERRQPGAGGRDRAHPRRDPRLRPREGAPPEGGAAEVGRADGALAGRRGTAGRLTPASTQKRSLQSTTLLASNTPLPSASRSMRTCVVDSTVACSEPVLPTA